MYHCGIIIKRFQGSEIFSFLGVWSRLGFWPRFLAIIVNWLDGKGGPEIKCANLDQNGE